MTTGTNSDFNARSGSLAGSLREPEVRDSEVGRAPTPMRTRTGEEGEGSTANFVTPSVRVLSDHMAVRQGVGRRIRRWRRLSLRTQAELACAVGVTQATLSHYETGKRDISVAILLRIAEELDVSVLDLTGTMPRTRHDAPHPRPGAASA